MADNNGNAFGKIESDKLTKIERAVFGDEGVHDGLIKEVKTLKRWIMWGGAIIFLVVLVGNVDAVTEILKFINNTR